MYRVVTEVKWSDTNKWQAMLHHFSTMAEARRFSAAHKEECERMKYISKIKDYKITMEVC